MHRRHGFTLLELLLAIMIALLLITVAVPGIASLFKEQELTKTFTDFNQFVQEALIRTVSERRAYHIIFDESGATLEPMVLRQEDEDAEFQRYQAADGATLAIERPAALMKNPPAEWPFWPSGICEPALVKYSGPRGSWTAEYDPLTVRGFIVEQVVK